jgi:small subunit ribosomal protein S24e
MKLEILKDEKNPLLSRREIRFKVEHEGKPTPPKKEVAEQLAAKLDADESLMMIEHYVTQFGRNTSEGNCYVYQNKKAMIRTEPTKILTPKKRLGISEAKPEEKPGEKKAGTKPTEEKKAEPEAKPEKKPEPEKEEAKAEAKPEKKAGPKKEEAKPKAEPEAKPKKGAKPKAKGKAKKKAAPSKPKPEAKKQAKPKKGTGSKDYGKELESVGGVGPKTRKEIISKFPTAEALKKAVKSGGELPFASNVNEALKKKFK